MIAVHLFKTVFINFLTRSITKAVGPVSHTGLARIIGYDTMVIAKVAYITCILNVERWAP